MSGLAYATLEGAPSDKHHHLSPGEKLQFLVGLCDFYGRFTSGREPFFTAVFLGGIAILTASASYIWRERQAKAGYAAVTEGDVEPLRRAGLGVAAELLAHEGQ